MGWDSTDRWTKKSIVVEETLERYNRYQVYQILASKVTKSGLWLVVRNRSDGRKGIFFDLIEKQGKRYYLKSMDESVHPYYYDCPKKFIDMVPPVSSESFNFNLEWRKQWALING